MSSKEDWFQIVDQEEGENLALSLIDDILTRSQHILFEKHIDVQVPPFAVNATRDTILSIINFKYFRRDPGNNDPNLWIPDEEPEPVVPDSWARSAVPIKALLQTTIRSRHIGEPVSKLTTSSSKIEQLKVSASAKGSQANSVESIAKEVTKKQSPSDSSSRPSKRNDATSLKKMPVPKIVQPATAAPASEPQHPTSARRRQSYRFSRSSISFGAGEKMNDGSLANEVHPPVDPYAASKALLSAEQAILEENKRMMSRIHNMQKEGTKVEYSFDQDGRVMLVTKVATPKLVSQGVKTRVLADKSGFSADDGMREFNDNAEDTRKSQSLSTTALEKQQKPRVMFRGTDSTTEMNNRPLPRGKSKIPASPKQSQMSPTRKLPKIKETATYPGHHVPRQPPAPQVFDLTSHHTHATGRRASLHPVNHQSTHHSEKTTLITESLGLLPGTSLLPPNYQDGFIPDPTLDLPPLSETIKLAPGVTLREGDSVRKGPTNLPRKAQASENQKGFSRS